MFSRIRVILSTMFFFMSCFVCYAQSASYEIIEIEPTTGYTETKAYGVNNNGEVAGQIIGQSGDKHAYMWNTDNGIHILNTLNGNSGVWDLNDNGQVAGYSNDVNGIKQAVRWESNGAITTLGQLTPNGTGGSFGIANNGDVVGYADVYTGWEIFHAFKYHDGSGMTDLRTFADPSQWYGGYSQAYDINNNGQSVGLAYDDDWNCHAFIHNDDNGMQMLQEDPAHPASCDSIEWYASAINYNEVIGGLIYNYSLTGSRPYYWPTPSSDPIAIAMPAEYPNAEIYGINDDEQMVGLMWNDSQDRAFMFAPVTGFVDLNSLVDSDSGWTLEFARDINDAGQIVGTGKFNGLTRAFILNPTVVPEPTSFVLFLSGAALLCYRKKRFYK